jgi:hypothetical protein
VHFFAKMRIILQPLKTKSLKIIDLQAFAVLISGERGIRTPGGVTLNGFQDRRIRPLCHLSGANVSAPD